jgi:rhamnogalacturonan endolyase
LTEDSSTYTLANGIVAAKVNKRSGDLVSLRYQGLELLGNTSGHPYGYWSHSPARLRESSETTIDPTRNGGARAEVSIKGYYTNRSAEASFRNTAADIEIRYTLGRDDSGIYTYSIFNHPASYPATGIGEARFGVKLNPKVFDFLSIDSRRQRLMPKPEDWDDGTELNLKEARRLTTGIYKGEVEHKYDYSAIQFDIPAFGWSSASQHVGLWFVNPSIEYLSGGATKVELTGHLDDNDGGAPTLLNYWRGSHYGGSICQIGAGEAWNKVIGPFLIYCNTGSSPAAMWKDALARAGAETAAWPYSWVQGVDYPDKTQRGTVSGKLVLADPQFPGLKMSNVLVGLAAPDYAARSGRFGGPRTVDWQLDAKHYEFWTRGGDDGRFQIENVRPGIYTLHALADGVLGEFSQSNIVVRAGDDLQLGMLNWQPVHYGRQLWEIGVPDRSAGEFRHGDHYWQWGLYYNYTNEFPHDVNYTIGRSDYHKDWNYAEVGRRGEGTTWSIHFQFAGKPVGVATLRLGIAAASVRDGIHVTVNDQPAGGTGPLLDTATIRRDGIRGYWTERDVAFDAALLKKGENVLKLKIPAGDPTSGVEYDYVRLELE